MQKKVSTAKNVCMCKPKTLPAFSHVEHQLHVLSCSRVGVRGSRLRTWRYSHIWIYIVAVMRENGFVLSFCLFFNVSLCRKKVLSFTSRQGL